MRPEPVILEGRQVSAGYYGQVVLQEVSFTAGPGEIVGVLGPNGAGKTTLLKAVAGLIRPVGGRILLRGEEIQHLGPAEVARRGLVYIPEGRHLFLDLTVAENLRIGAHVPRARAYLNRSLGVIYRLFPVLGQRQHAQARELSGGQQQILALARGLMARPVVLLLDDPFAGLGRGVADQFCRALRSICAEGTTIIVAGQHVNRILDLANRVYVLNAGRVVVAGPPAELRAGDILARLLF